MLIITSQTNHIVHDLFNVCSNHTKFKLQRISSLHFVFDVTMKQSQGHQPYNDNADPKETTGNYYKLQENTGKCPGPHTVLHLLQHHAL